MEIAALTSLLPVERPGLPVLNTRGEQRADLPAERPGTREEFVFLGYGSPSAQGLYDDSGKYVSSRGMPGSVVDLYA